MSCLSAFLALCGAFILTETIPCGAMVPNNRIHVGDYNRNGLVDFAFGTRNDTMAFAIVVERQGSNVFIIADTVACWRMIWDDGDFDSDGCVDFVTTGDTFIGLSVYESPDSFSYPTQEVWRDTVGYAVVAPVSAFDIDQDGFPEIVTDNGNGSPNWVWIYESCGPNQYDTVCTINEHTSTSTHGFGDFDQDGQIEFAMSSIGHSSTGAPYWVYECTGDNSYEQVASGYVPTLNVKDCFSVPDADGDGKWEFVIKGYYVGGTIDAFIFEATGENIYALKDTLHFPGGDYYGGYSASSDVDGDSIPELVIEALNNIQIVKAYGNDSFAVWQTLPGNSSGSTVAVYDIDGNGPNEVIISGVDNTRIYEWQTAVEEMPAAISSKLTMSVTPTVFREYATISYCLASSTDVSLMLYDTSGRLVRVLAEGWQTPGEHQCMLQGTDLPQGVYFVRLGTETGSATQKVLVMR